MGVETHWTMLGLTVRSLSFPGREAGSLGSLVYQLHHEPSAFGLGKVTSEAQQALHIAAHLDSIDRIIAPAMQRGEVVLLDRFWWSTWVYGRAAGANVSTLDGLIGAERSHWGDRLPTAVVLLQRPAPFRPELPNSTWRRLTALYENLATNEASSHPVLRIANVAAIDETVSRVIHELQQFMDNPHRPHVA